MVSKSVNRSVDLTNLISKTLFTKQLIKRDDRLLFSISGGQDSLCLLLLLNQLYAQMELHLGLFWCNHLWQIDSFSLMRQITKISFAFQFDGSFAITPKFVPSELLARNWRHNCTYRSCLFYNYSKIILAHSANDKVETILLNLLRGTGLTGLVSLQLNSSFLVSKEKEKHLSHISTFPMFLFSWSPFWLDLLGLHNVHDKDVQKKNTKGIFFVNPLLTYSFFTDPSRITTVLELQRSQTFLYSDGSLPPKGLHLLNPYGVSTDRRCTKQELKGNPLKKTYISYATLLTDKVSGICAIFLSLTCNKTNDPVFTSDSKRVNGLMRYSFRKSTILTSLSPKLTKKLICSEAIYEIEFNTLCRNSFIILTLDRTKNFAATLETIFFPNSNLPELLVLPWTAGVTKKKYLQHICPLLVVPLFNTSVLWIPEKIFFKKQKNFFAGGAKFYKDQVIKKKKKAKIWFHFVSYLFFKTCSTSLQQIQQKYGKQHNKNNWNILDTPAKFLHFPNIRSFNPVTPTKLQGLKSKSYTWLQLKADRFEKTKCTEHSFLFSTVYRQMKIKVSQDIFLVHLVNHVSSI